MTQIYRLDTDRQPFLVTVQRARNLPQFTWQEANLALADVQYQCRARLLDERDVLNAGRRAILDAKGWGSAHGGFIANSYRGEAWATAVLAVRTDQRIVVVVARGPASKRPRGVGATEDVAVAAQIPWNVPAWVADPLQYGQQLKAWAEDLPARLAAKRLGAP